jgi:tRNA pseudouridine55 synthase
MDKFILINKKLGQTPLEAILAYKKETGETRPMTYAGRLDPMAEGLLICLVGDECKNKEKYTELDKEYEFEILVGFSTDTHDILGLITEFAPQGRVINLKKIENLLGRLIGVHDQVYPAYSSKTVGGTQLHALARKGLIAEESLPSRKIEIFSISKLEERTLSKENLQNEIRERIELVKGDFRQREILDKWDSALTTNTQTDFQILKFKMRCSSGTYVRALVRDISKQTGIPMCVFSIKRTRVGEYFLEK